MAKTCCPVDTFSAECLADPYPTYRVLRETAPVSWTRAGFWLVTRHADVAALLTDRRCDHWGQEPEGSHHRSSLDAALAAALRQLAPPSSSAAASHGLRRAVAAVIAQGFDALADLTMRECDARLAALRGRRTVEVMGDYAHPVTCRGISRLMGVPDGDLDTVSDLVAALDGDVLSCAAPQQRPRDPRDADTGAGVHTDAADAFIGYLQRLVLAKRARPSDDLISAILQREPDTRMEGEQLLPLIVLLFHAGHQNMMNFIGNALLALMASPDALAALRRSPSLMARAVPELLRYDSPVQHIALVCREPLIVCDQAIAPGEPIFACVGSANRDPAAFVDPDRLDLARAPVNHLSFGTGAWRCMGAKLAERQGAAALACLLARLPSFTLSETPITWRSVPVVQRGPASLTIDLHPHD